MSMQVCGPNEAMVKTGMCVGNGGRMVYTGGCTCFWPCVQELHRMELTVMTITVHSGNVVTAEGVEITAEGLTQVRIDPGMAEDQADAMISAKNEDIEHKVEEVIREKTLYNKAKQEEETVKGVPGVTQVRVVTITRDATTCAVAGEINEGKKRLAAFVGPAGRGVTERVFAECHRRLKSSGMCPYWIKEMPNTSTEISFDMEVEKLVEPGWTSKQKEQEHVAIKAAEKAFGALTPADHPQRKVVYDATGYWPGSMGPVQIYITEIGDKKQSYISNDMKVFHPSIEPGQGCTVAEVKKLLSMTAFTSPTKRKVRGQILEDFRPDDVELVYFGKGENEYGQLIDCADDKTVLVRAPGKEERAEKVKVSLFQSFVGCSRPSDEASGLERINVALKLADCRVGPSREDESPDELHGLEDWTNPLWITDEQTFLIIDTEDDNEKFDWIDKIDKAIVHAQNIRRETAKISDRKAGTVLTDNRTLLEFKISQGDCFGLRPKPGVKLTGPEPEPQSDMSAETNPLMAKMPGLDDSGKTGQISDAQRKEEEMDSEAHEGDSDFRKKVVATKELGNLARAASQFVSKTREEIIDMVRETLEGHQRAIMAELTVDEIYKDRLMFQRKVRETADVDLAKMGLRVISYTLKDVSDANGYMQSLGVRRIEEVKKEARMGEAQESSEADQRCHLYKAQVVQKQKECETEVASSKKNFTMREQEWKNEIVEAQQEAAMQTALELEVQNKKIAELKGAVDATRVKWQTKLETLEKERMEKMLEADENLVAQKKKEESIILSDATRESKMLIAKAEADLKLKIAEAEAQVITQDGQAAAQVMEAKADAWTSYGEKSYIDMVVEQLPEIAENLVTPLNKIDKMVMINGEGDLGASKVTAEVARVMTQVPDVVESLTGVQLKGMLAGIES